MAFTTYDQLMDDIVDAAGDVSSLKKVTKFAPTIVSDGQHPWLYPRIPVASNVTSTLTYEQGLNRASIEIVVLVAPMLLNTQEKNLQAVVTMLDTLVSFLQTNAALFGMDSYSINPQDGMLGGERPYYALVASVEVSGGA